MEQAGVPGERVFHLHGDVTGLETLLLPTEIVPENFRDVRHRKKLGQMHSQMQRTIGAASRIVLFGLSLSPLDAELAQHISSGFSDHANPPPISVINLRSDMQRVVDRVGMLWARGKISVEQVEVEESG